GKEHLVGPDDKRHRKLRKSEATYRYTLSNGKVAHAELTLRDQTYRFVGAVNSTTTLLHSGDGAAGRYGPVVTVQLDRRRDTFTITPVARSVAEQRDGNVVIAPDKQHALLEGRQGWYVVQLPTPSKPRHVDDAGKDDEAYVLAWSS